ncbi:hypothetical protein TYRP_013806, partial [Tyrophagus putrescentiae]
HNNVLLIHEDGLPQHRQTALHRVHCPRRRRHDREQDNASGPRSLDMDEYNRAEGCNDEDYYEDDYDHLYVDTDGAEQYLREIWTALGVGDNGYLNLGELYRVCEHIGMTASEEMIEQLFDKLDNDQDGRVSFVEFVDGLFKYVHKTAAISAGARQQQQLPPLQGPRSISGSSSPATSVSRPTTAAGAGAGHQLTTTNISVSSSPEEDPSALGCSSSVHHSPNTTSTLPSSTTTASPHHLHNQLHNHHHHHHHLLINSNSSTTTNSTLIHDGSEFTGGFISFPTDKDGLKEEANTV